MYLELGGREGFTEEVFELRLNDRKEQLYKDLREEHFT